MTDKPKTKSVTVELTDETFDNFECVEEHMKRVMPGVKFDRASIARHAFHLAAKQVIGSRVGISCEVSGDSNEQ